MSRYPKIQDKLMSLEDAVKKFIKDGCQIALGGFTVSRNPMAITHEIIRQGIKDLHLVCHSHGQAFDLLIGAGCVKRVEIAYGANGKFASTCIRFRKAAEKGDLEVEDYSNNQMTLRFLAGSLGIPFIPCNYGFGSDILKLEGFDPAIRGKGKISSKKIVIQKDPFSDNNRNVVLLPALRPDVALIHAQFVGDDGTVRIKGLTFADLEQAKSADRVIVTCDEIVPAEWLRIDPDQNSLPGFMVDAIVHVPYGAYPTASYYFYDYDAKHLNMYKNIAKDDKLFKQYLEQWIYSVSSQSQYLDMIGGARLMEIKANSVTGYTPGLDRR